MKTISKTNPFKAGDEVYYYEDEAKECVKYTVRNANSIIDYGWVPVGERSLIWFENLSFTPYDNLDNGFTHVRPDKKQLIDELDKKIDAILPLIKDLIKFILIDK
jgi:hypothetical protein